MTFEIKKCDKSGDIIVDTYRSGRFKFQIGFDRAKTTPLFTRVIDAHDMFNRVPILPEIAKKLENNVLVSSVFGTNTIEGGTITEDEIKALFAESLPPQSIVEEKKRRVTNIKEAYDIADKVALIHRSGADSQNQAHYFGITETFIILLHQTITGGLAHPKNIAGQYRNNAKGEYTRVGDLEHGGIYTPPKCLDDIKILIQTYVEWINSKPVRDLHPIERAHLAHYYFERIHPFYDGNGRVGRVIEATILKCSGMNYAPFALASSYLEQIDDYFLAFNLARKAEERKEPYPNTAFLTFCLERLRNVFDNLHASVNNIIRYLLYTNALNTLHAEKKINIRQFTIINNLLPHGFKHNLKEIKAEVWYSGLYADLTQKTRERDLKKLSELKLIVVENGVLTIKLP